MRDSILITIKKMLGLEADYTPFDDEIIVHINSVLMILNQLGVGNSVTISGPDECWGDFLGGSKELDGVKTYVGLRTRMIFDPPTSSSAVEAMKSMCSELEWRLHFSVN